ncbi:uncharacterized protein [Lepeophtheirus salmonis]|nr:uncharacterized protein LOC121114006 [Lepeophtheirus salmonis]
MKRTATELPITRHPTNQHYYVPIIFLLLTLLVPITTEKCPPRCQCLWRNSKITADCTNRELESIPVDIEVNTQVLNISGNDIPSLIKDQFSRLGLTNLQRVAASGCGLSSIHDHAFSGLTNLVELELADNHLQEIPTKSLSEVPGIMSLILRNNPFRIIRSDAFSALSQLSKLDLSNCQIETIETGSFSGLRDLQRLYLHANRISELDPSQTLPASLHGISLHDNRWMCDCRLRNFRHWLTKNQYVPRPVEPACIGPRRLLGLRVQSLSLTEFACKPQLSPTSMFLTVPYGKNISILCKVIADPMSQISWTFNGKRLFRDEYEASIGDSKRKILLEKGRPSSRSELIIFNTDASDNGTYYCKAWNKAGESTSNFTLKVANPLVASPRILKLPLEYFVGVAIAIIIILILVLTTAGILLLRICRQRLENRGNSRSVNGGDGTSIIVSSATTDLKKMNDSTKIGGILLRKNGSTNKIGPNGNSSKMPRYIQMGTGFSVNGSSCSSSSNQQQSQAQQQPDLIKPGYAVSSNKSFSESSSQGSYRLAMENIIDEYRQSSEEQNSSSSPTSCISPSHRLIRNSSKKLREEEEGFGSSLLCSNSSSSGGRKGISCISSREDASSCFIRGTGAGESFQPRHYYTRHEQAVSLPHDFGLPPPPSTSNLGFQQLQPYSLLYMDQLNYLNRRPMRPDEMYPETNYTYPANTLFSPLSRQPSSLTPMSSTVETQTQKDIIEPDVRGSPDGSKMEVKGSSEGKEESKIQSGFFLEALSSEETSSSRIKSEEDEIISETNLNDLKGQESDIIESFSKEENQGNTVTKD